MARTGGQRRWTALVAAHPLVNGPDLHVYLAEAPADADPARFRSAVIWCKRFAVGFAVAPLTAT